MTAKTGEPCEFEHDDGAYILGALSPTERTEFERHLALCPPCRQSVADLAVLPGLLGRLRSYPSESGRPDPLGSAGELESWNLQATAGPAPQTLLPRLLTAATQARQAQRRAQRLRRLRVAVAAVVVGIAAATAIGVGVHLYDHRTAPALFTAPEPSPSPQQPYSAMWNNPDAGSLTAEISLSRIDGGTLVSVRCHETGSGGGSWPLWLVVYPRDEDAEPIGSWVATPGQNLSMTGLTHYSPDQIDRIEVQNYHQATLLWWKP